MKATFDLKIFNDVTLAGSKCTLTGVVYQDIVTLNLKGEHSGVEIELSAFELVNAAARISGHALTIKEPQKQ